MNQLRCFDRICETDGSGLWSYCIRQVQCTEMELHIYDEDFDSDADELFGELRIYFDPATWDVEKHGLIYTDRMFIFDVRRQLKDLGYDSSDIHFSEQGMQGRDYVSLDAGATFCQSWLNMDAPARITEDTVDRILEMKDLIEPMNGEEKFMLKLKLMAKFGAFNG